MLLLVMGWSCASGHGIYYKPIISLIVNLFLINFNNHELSYHAVNTALCVPNVTNQPSLIIVCCVGVVVSRAGWCGV